MPSPNRWTIHSGMRAEARGLERLSRLICTWRLIGKGFLVLLAVPNAAEAAGPTPPPSSPAGTPSPNVATPMVLVRTDVRTSTPNARTATAGASQTVSPVGTATPTATVPDARAASAGASQTVSPVGTATPTPTVGPVLAIGAISPLRVLNTESARLSLTGAGFASGLVVQLGGRQLEDVSVSSSTTLSASVPAGVCPGTYPVTVRDRVGHRATSGSVLVKGIRTARLGPPAPEPTILLNGRTQHLDIPLRPIEVVDTTCDSGDWLLTLALDGAAATESTGPIPRALRLLSASGDLVAAVPLKATEESRVTLIRIPHTNAPSQVLLHTELEIELPASVRAGRYAPELSITLTPDSLPIGADVN